MAGLQLLYTYVPLMQRLFGTTDIGLLDWAVIIGLGLVMFVVVGLEKRLTNLK